MKLELYYFKQCPFCAKVLRKIDELELTNHIDFKSTLESQENGEYHYNKTGRSTVPCLYIDDNPMFESNDINDWLDKNSNIIKEK